MTAEAFKQTFLQYHPHFYRIAFRMLGNAADAQDAVQDLYVRLWNSRNSIEDLQNAESYGVTLIRNRCIDRLRSAGYKAGRDAVPADSATGIQNDRGDQDELTIESQDNLRLIKQLADKLPGKQKEVFELHYFKDLTIDEIVKLTGESAANVRVLLHRSRTTVKEQFDQINKTYSHEDR